MKKSRLKEMAEINEMDGYEKIDNYNYRTVNSMARHYHEVLKLIGEDPDREGLQDTPVRVAKSMQFLTHGYMLNPEEILLSAMFKEVILWD
jgi:GTP cyclohydrolase I